MRSTDPGQLVEVELPDQGGAAPVPGRPLPRGVRAIRLPVREHPDHRIPAEEPGEPVQPVVPVVVSRDAQENAPAAAGPDLLEHLVPGLDHPPQDLPARGHGIGGVATEEEDVAARQDRGVAARPPARTRRTRGAPPRRSRRGRRRCRRRSRSRAAGRGAPRAWRRPRPEPAGRARHGPGARAGAPGASSPGCPPPGWRRSRPPRGGGARGAPCCRTSGWRRAGGRPDGSGSADRRHPARRGARRRGPWTGSARRRRRRLAHDGPGLLGSARSARRPRGSGARVADREAHHHAPDDRGGRGRPPRPGHHGSDDLHAGRRRPRRRRRPSWRRPSRRACSYWAAVGSPEGSANTSPSRSCGRFGSARRIATLRRVGGREGRAAEVRLETRRHEAAAGEQEGQGQGAEEGRARPARRAPGPGRPPAGSGDARRARSARVRSDRSPCGWRRSASRRRRASAGTRPRRPAGPARGWTARRGP